MSRQRESLQRLALYHELHDIMGAMKNLAQAEIHKLRRRQQQQNACLDAVTQAVDAVHRRINQHRAPAVQERHLWLVIGSERGFCGGFNEALIRALQETPKPPMRDVIIMGARLQALLENEDAPAASLIGPSSEKQVSAAMIGLLEQLQRLQQESRQPLRLTALCHDVHEVRQLSLLPYKPAAATPASAPEFRHLEPLTDLLQNVEDHYLYHALLALLYSSLYAENHRRLMQMEGALQHLDELSQQTRMRLNAQRQEEIVEEIEVIFASTPGYH